jgi:hypothetical protein
MPPRTLEADQDFSDMSTERTAEISTFNRSIDLGQYLLFLKFTKVFVSSDVLTQVNIPFETNTVVNFGKKSC